MGRFLTRYRWWLLAYLVLVIGIYLSCRTSHPVCQDGVTRAGYNRLRVGMTKEEVQAILGESSPFSSRRPRKIRLEWVVHHSLGDNLIGVMFDDRTGRVVDGDFQAFDKMGGLVEYESFSNQDGLVGRFRQWLGL